MTTTKPTCRACHQGRCRDCLNRGGRKLCWCIHEPLLSAAACRWILADIAESAREQ
jgi:hypothetical protein